MKTQLWFSLGKNSYSLLNRPKVSHKAFGVLAGLALLTAALLPHPAVAAAGINAQMNFQGRLLNAAGAVVPDGNYNVEFKIYSGGPGNTAGDTGGTLQWTEDWLNANSNGVVIRNGYFSVSLGSITSLSPVDFNSDTLWLSMNIGDTFSNATFAASTPDGEMLPMKRLTANPYAFNSALLNGLSSTAFGQLSANNTWSGTNLFQPAASSTALVVSNATNAVLTVDTSANQVVIGKPGAQTAKIEFANATGSNTVGLQAGASTAAYDLTLPTVAPSTSQCLQAGSTTATLLQWGSCGGGSLSLAAVDSAGTANANGATLTGSTLNLNSADGTHPGVVNAAAQTFGGSKTFIAATTVKADSTSAFTVQNSAGNLSLLNADTTNLKVSVSDGQLTVNGYGGMAAPTFSAGSNQGGTLSGSAATTYYYQYTVINAIGESASSAEGSFAASGFTPLTPPGAPTLASALGAGLGNGTYRYKVTFVTANGETTGGTEATVATSLTNGQVNVTNIPTGPAGTTQRKLYRTVVNGGSGTEKLLTTIANNTTTTFTDTTADGSLGAALPGSNTARTNTNNLSVIIPAQPGASSYRVYRGTTSGSENAYQTSASTPFTDTGAAGTAATPPTGDTIGSLGVGVSAPLAKLHVQTQAGSIAEILQGASSQASDLLQLRDSAGIVMSGFNNLGQLTLGTIAPSGTVYGGALKFADGTTDNFGATLNTTTLTANHTISLPNANGTVCLQLASACGFALSDGSTTGYIQNTTSPQTANFNITGNGTVGGTVYTPALDTASAVNLTIGQTNASSIVLAENTTLSAGKSLTVTGSGVFPASPVAGQIYYRTDTNQLYIYNGTKWQTDRSVATKIVTDGSTSQTPERGDYMVPAGSTSADTTINTALNSLPAGGGVVYLAEGTFTITNPITIPSNVALVGSGDGTIIKLKSNAFGITGMVTNKNATDSDVEVSSLTIDGNSTSNSGISFDGVHLTGTTNALVTNLTIQNLPNNGSGLNNIYCGCGSSTISQNNINGGDIGIWIRSSRYNKIVNNYVTAGLDGIDDTAPSNLANDLISQNTITGGSEYSIFFDGIYYSVTDNAIDTTTLGGAGAGIYVSNGVTSNNFTISGNSIIDNGASQPTGIYVSGTSGSSISGNLIRGGGYAMDIEPSSTTNISSNDIYASATGGIYLNTSQKMTISSNTVTGSGSCSTGNIYLFTTTLSSVSGNTTYGGCLGIYLNSSDNNTVTGNSTSRATAEGIFVNGSSQNTVSSNNMEGDGVYAISIIDSPTTTVVGNSVNNPGSNGIYFSGISSNGSVSDNRVKNAYGNGIQIGSSAGSTGNKVTDNNVTYAYPGTTTLSAAIASTSATTLTVTSNPGYGNWAPGSSYVILIDSEQMLVTSGHNGATTWTVQRGYNSTTAATHLNGATVSLIYSGIGIKIDSTAAGGYVSDNFITTSGSGAGYSGTQINDATGASMVGQVNGSGFYLLQPTGGRVGIGTNSPQQSLSVNGGVNIDQGGTAGATTLTGGLTFGSSSNEGINSNRSGAGLNQNGLDLYTAAVPRLSITNAGLLGINNTNPQFQLDLGKGNIAIDMSVPTGIGATANLTGGNLAAGTYRYEVVAVDGGGGLTLPSFEASATTTGVTASVTVSWTLVGGAASYRIYRTPAGGASGSENVYFTAGGGSNTFTDTGAAGTSATPPTVNSAYSNAIGGGIYSANGFNGITSTCSGGQYLQNPVMVGGIVTGGTCNIVSGGSASLQTAYTNSTGGTTPEIIVDSTRAGIDIQDANTTLGAGTTLLAVRASATSTTLGTLQFGVTNNGNVTNLGSLTTGSSGQFQVSNAGVMTLQTTFSPSGGGTQTASSITVTNSPTSTANTAVGLKIALTDATALANTVQGFVVDTSGITNSSANVTTALFKLKSSSTGFQIQNSSGFRIFTADLNQIDLGQSNSMVGALAFNNDTNANQVILEANSGSAGYILVLPSATGSTGQCVGLSSVSGGRHQLGFQTCQATHTRTVALTAEYAGATLDSAADASCSGANTGTMTSGLSKTGTGPYTVNSYYNWTSSSASTQCYDVAIRVPIPADWSSWNSNGVTVSYWGDSTANSSGALDILGGDGSQEGTSYGTSLTVSSASTWLTATSAALTDAKYSAGGTFTLRVRMNAKSSANFRIGNITINYTSSF